MPGSPAPAPRAAHLVLGAGGVRVVSYIGALAVLAEAGFAWQTISASSAGTFLGALLASGLAAQEIERRVMAIDLRRLAGTQRALGKFSVLRPPFSRYTESGVPAAFREIVGGDPRLGELAIPLATAGVDILSNRLLVYSSDTHPEMPVSEALRIAVGSPGLYPAYEPQGRVVVDAAIATQIPVWLVPDDDVGLPIVALSPRRSVEPESPHDFGSFLTRIVESGIECRDHYVVQQIARARSIRPDCGALAAHDFEAAERRKAALVERGRIAAQEALVDFDSPVRMSATDHGPAGSDHDRAEVRARRAMVAFNHSFSRQARNRVFISYAHADRHWLERLQTFLAPHVRYENLVVWDDTQIAAGARWRDEIRQALRCTRVALLLVTANYLASEFIADEELGYFLRASEREGLRLVWVAVEHCGWDVTPIREFQAANDPKQPLDSLPEPEQNRVLTQVCEQVRAVLLA